MTYHLLREPETAIEHPPRNLTARQLIPHVFHLHLPTANGRLKFLEEHVAGLSENVEGTRHPSKKSKFSKDGWWMDGWMDMACKKNIKIGAGAFFGKRRYVTGKKASHDVVLRILFDYNKKGTVPKSSVVQLETSQSLIQSRCGV